MIAGIERERKVTLVRSLWSELPPQQRQIFDLVDLQGHAPSQVAEMLDMNAATVRAHLFKARRALRMKLLARSLDREEEEAQ